MMKVLITGANGQLGSAMQNSLKSPDFEFRGVDIADFDLTNNHKTVKYIEEYKPDAVIHCAAYTAVDRAEEEKEKCYNINVNGTKNIAEACGNIKAKLIYISTDYVFDGTNNYPYETSDKQNPLSHYGLCKYLGEQAVKELERVFIVRTSWVFGENGHNFIDTMLNLGRQAKTIRVVNDQNGSPTYTLDLAGFLCELIKTEKYGIYHATNEGFCTWYEYADYIFECAGLKADIIPVTSEEYGAPAVRPKNSRLSKQSLDDGGFSRLPDWKDAVNRYLKNKLIYKILEEI